MKKIHRNIGIVVAAFVVLLLLLPLIINVNSFRPKIESELSNALGRKVEVGDLSLSILRGSVSAANIQHCGRPGVQQVALPHREKPEDRRRIDAAHLLEATEHNRAHVG